jgi:hypothetical protein
MIFLRFLGIGLLATGVLGNACFNVAFGPSGTCNSDPSDNDSLEAYIIQDHAVTGCSAGATFTAVVKYLDTSGVTQTKSAITTQTVNASFVGTLPFDFMVPIAAIESKKPVTFKIKATNTEYGGTLSTNVIYTQKHISTLGYFTRVITVPLTVNTTKSKQNHSHHG